MTGTSGLVLGLIPARYGSTRLPRKNVRPLSGRPLVKWVLDEAVKSETLDLVAVTSDDSAVLEIGSEYPGVQLIRRPAELAAADSPAIDYVKHALGVIDADVDVVVILQPTSPLVLARDIDETVRLLGESGADSAVTAVRVRHDLHPVKYKRLMGDRLIPFLEPEDGRMAAQDLDEVYVRSCAVYATRSEVLASGELIGADCRAVVVPAERSVDINDELDFAWAEFLVQRMHEHE